MHLLYFSKQNEWTDQLKYCPSLPTTFPISQAIFEFHLEKITRLWRRSNFGTNFRFLRKTWTGDLLHPSEQPVIKRVFGEYGGCGKTSHLSVSKYFLTTLATCDRALSWRRITLCLCSYSVFLAMHGSNESIVAMAVIKSTGFSSS